MIEPPGNAELRLADVLGQEFDPPRYKMHCARRNPNNEDPLESDARGDWDTWVSWNRTDLRDEFNRPRISSLMQVEPGSMEWVFGGIFHVIARTPEPQAFSYDVELVRGFTEPLIGRMRVRFSPPGRATRLKLENYFSTVEVVEITKLPGRVSRFPVLTASTMASANLRSWWLLGEMTGGTCSTT